MPSGQAFLASQMAAAAQAAANREAALRRRAEADEKQFEAAQQAESEGDLAAASMLYQRLALRRPASSTTTTARDKLKEIQTVALGKLKALEDELTQIKRPEGTPFAPVQLDGEKVTKSFQQLDALLLEYAGVATVEGRIQDRIRQLRGDGKFAAVLQEPPAAELWKLGQSYEQQQQSCCAVLVYEQAAALSPAPTAKLARARLKELERDATVMASVKRCRTLQLCHEKFRKAEQLKKLHPDEAREHLARILEMAPADTSIHRAAREQLAMLQ